MVAMTDDGFRRAGFCPRRALGWLLLATTASCGGGGAEPPPELTVFRAEIGPAGGSVYVPTGVHTGVELEVPPGAVDVPTEFTIRTDVQSPRVLSLFPVYRFEPAALMCERPFRITLRIGSLLAQGGAFDSICFRKGALAEPWNIVSDCAVAPGNQHMTVTTERLGDFVVWNGALHRLFTCESETFDPAQPSPIENLRTGSILIENGSDAAFVGRGEANQFWQASSADNLLILHGLLSSPLDFLGPNDLVEMLSPASKNVLFYQYPSALGVAATANSLYNEIKLRRLPGFRCSILGHSLGGLVARYLLEKSADDPARPGYRPEDEPLTDCVVNLILLAVPNAGSELGGALLGTLVPQVPLAEAALVQSADDLSFSPQAITNVMNASYVDNPTRYFVLYGDVNYSGSDGVVTVASALALPLFWPETSTRFEAEHNELHTSAGSLGVAARIDTILQLP
jgi:pimeloyl-ACP methyl ester carboxylesterase